MTIECFPIHTSHRCCGTSNGTGRRELSGEEKKKKKRITRCAFQLSDVLRNSLHSRSKHDIHNLNGSSHLFLGSPIAYRQRQELY